MASGGRWRWLVWLCWIWLVAGGAAFVLRLVGMGGV